MEINSLLKKCLQNDRKAQFALYDHFFKHISIVCERYSNDLATAKDNVQTTFIKIFKKLDQFDERKGNFKSWINRIAINECLMAYRKNKQLMLTTEISDASDFVELHDFGANVDLEILLKIVDELPNGYRTVFLLNVVDGYSHKEISEQLEITENTSRSQLYSARKILMKKLENWKDLYKAG